MGELSDTWSTAGVPNTWGAVPVLFNRFLQPDIDLETMTVKPELHLSTNEELRLPLRWIAILPGARSREPGS
jgi:dihydroorotate dehydrogenase (fumarate)